MRRVQRRLSPDEAALWARVASTVKPLGPAIPHRDGEGDQPQADGGTGEPIGGLAKARQAAGAPTPPLRGSPPPRPGEERKPRTLDRHGLDASWDRKLAQGIVQPDFTLDLHGHSLDAAHTRLDHGLALAQAQGARVVLLITGRSRASDDHAGRGERRGAIRAKFLDWLAAGSHASRIAAVRPAHPRHGGAGAVYIVLKRSR